jgi:hypothetical protein
MLRFSIQAPSATNAASRARSISQASFTRVQLVLNAVGFGSSLAVPTTTARTISVRTADGLGGTSALQSKAVNINVPPVIGSIGPAVSYNKATGVRVSVFPTASITVAGSNVLFNGTIIGTFTGGAVATPLVFTFNNQASFSRVQLVLNAVGFASSLAAPSTTPRSISVRVTDGLGGTSALQSKLVNII